MASELRVNTLKDAAGNNSIATSFVAGGSAKAWVNNKQHSGNNTRDSLNIASVTDHATGDFETNFTSSMGNTDYCFTAGGQRGDNANEDFNISGYTATYTDAFKTGSTRLVSYHASSANQTDGLANCVSWMGDLA